MMRIVRSLLPLLVIFAGVAIFIGLKRTKPEAKKVPHEEARALVELLEVHPSRQLVSIEARGTVIPAREVVLSPEVAGRVTWINDNLVPGSRLKKGERLVKIDARDYTLAVEQQYAAFDRAQTELEIEKSRKKIAEREWELFGKKQGESGSDGKSVALREPQMRTAQVAVKSAESGLARAKLNVSKTSISSPFNATVSLRNVEKGQMVSPATPLLTLVGTDAYWVQVSVPVDRLPWLQIPGVGGSTKGSSAEIVQMIGKQKITRQGEVIRLLGGVDPNGRMARLLVEIPDPLGLDAKPAAGTEQPGASSTLPLLLNAYVEVFIEGREVDGVVTIAREALRDNDTVFLYKNDDTLEIREVDVLWRRPEEVLIAGGLSDGDELIVSPLAAPVDGMRLRTADSTKEPEPEPTARAEEKEPAPERPTAAKPEPAEVEP